MKILNLYAGIGGNRKLWGDKHEVTAIEHDPKIAKIYQDFFPNDNVIITDAHKYLLEHFKEFDFIWSSPPCPTHSDIRRAATHRGQNKPVYPNMELYEEIILLKHFAPLNCKWVVENVRPYYKPLIEFQKSGRHCFWANFKIPYIKSQNHEIHNSIIGSQTVYGFSLNKFKWLKDKRQLLRNLVNPKISLHVFNCAFKEKQEVLA